MEITTRAGNGAAGENALNKVSAGMHGAVDKVAGTADDIARKVKPAIDRVAEAAHHAVDKAADAAAPTAQWLSSQKDSLNRTGHSMAADANRYVSANPWKAIGAALVAGILISRVIR